ncbi:uncharacterized protein LOC124132556 isoform X1 [Haliotis rufescens]|uniref:uncharacterized protein LOC124132556 isoform X1 n=1 Tax=Haliotis rufescens TaxID=6454 RepID=UPI00201EC525|nr:uncharacterized protein LOC124132556 isoform X1 [Haliotis rufescens]
MPQTRSSRKRDLILSDPATGVEVKTGRIRRNPKSPSVDKTGTSEQYQQSNAGVATTKPMTSELKDVLQDLVRTLSKRVDERSTYVQRQQRVITEARERKESNQDSIAVIVANAVDRIKHKEEKMMTELEEVTEKQLQQLNAELLKEEAELHICKQQSDFINKAVHDGDKAKYQSFLAEVMDFKEGMSNGDVIRPINTITFNQDSERVDKAVDNLQLAKVDFTYRDNPLYTPTLVNTINCTSLDEKAHAILAQDVTVLDIDGMDVVVVTDSRNHQLISFYTGNNGPCFSVLPLEHYPHGITHLKENRVIIALPKIAQLVIVEVTPELTLLSTIPCGRYYSVAVLSPTTLVAGGGQHGTGYCVDIIDMDGNVMRSISNSLIHYSAYLFVDNNGNIVVSDGKANSVFCMTPEGDLVWKHDHSRCMPSIVYPDGIIQTSTGDILVSGWLNSVRKVVLLTDTGEFVRDVLTPDQGVHNPSGLCLDKRGHLFVCDGNDIKEFAFTEQHQ